MASLKKLLLLSAFVASTVAVPVKQTGECARYCTKDSDFSLSPGNMYTYDYETTTVTTVQGSSDKTQLQMTAQADIQVLSKCELSLRLRGVTLKLSDPESPDYLVALRGAREFARTIERYNVRFSYQNGQVEHICPSENAPDWVTNIHRGALSAFQSFAVKPEWTTRTQETDVLGRCTAEYHSLGKNWQGTHTVRKLKDLNSCTDRENVETYLQGSPYSQDFQTQSLPVVTGRQECEQVIGNNFLQTSTCNEKLVFRPFSSRGNGVVTTVSQKLTYAATSQRTFTGNDYRPTTETLLYSHARQEVNSAKVEEETETALRQLCEASQNDISIEVPRKFSAFVYKLKKLPFGSLKAFFQKTGRICPDNQKARKFFMDAIPLVSTSDSARFMFEMIEKKEISETESNFWLTSLAFITESSPEIIGTFTPFLDGRYDQAILGISALIRNFCKSKDCAAIPQVQAAVHKLADNLGENCFNSDDKKVILSLKAIGNIGYMFGKERLLEFCYKNPQIRNEARMAAIEAFRRVSCDVDRSEHMKTYSNYNEDTEIRIAAYLAVMKCPNQEIVQQVKDVLLNEKINHVGSFIWTHLSALARSKHPERQSVRDIVSNLYLLNKFETDARKFSSAHEANFFLESIDSGIHLDSHLIYSTESYLPRTAMLNLTVDIFGKSCNLLQLDGRIEGFERVVESFFGPSGYFPQKNVARLLRERRSVDNNKLKQIDSQFKEHFQNEQPYGSMDVKVFGTSMWYGQYRHNDDGTPDINLLDIVTKLAEENEKEYSRSFMFLDSTFTIPMTSGLPLKIALNGTASVGLKIGGKFDVKSFEHVDVMGHIEPSGAIEITGLLTVDAGHVARSGMRIISTMHSSSILDGKLHVRKGEVVKAQLNMPRDRIDVFNMQSKMYIVHGSEEREKITRKREGTHLQSCTGRTVSKVFGVKLCSELDLPPYRVNTPLQPLNGPARFNVYIEKTDPTLKSYNFDAQWKTEMKNGGLIKHGIFSLNTPESQTDRDVNVELHFNQADHTATLKVKTPVKKFGVNGKLVNTDSQKKADFSLTVDDKDYFSMQSEVGISNGKNAVAYTPSLVLRAGSKRLVAVSGMADLRHGQKYSAQLKVEDLTQKPILAKGNIEIGKRDKYDIEMSLNSFPLDGTLKGFAQLGDNLSTKLTADYKILEGKMNKLSIVGKMRNLSASALTKYTGVLNIQASVLPEWNTELAFETMHTTGHIENSISVSLGDGARSRVHTIKMQEILRYEGSLLNNKVDGTFKIQYPEKNVDYSLNVKHENTEDSLKNMLQVQYAQGRQVNTDVHLRRSTGSLFSMAGDVKVQYPGRETALSAELSQSSNKEFRATAFCQWQTGRHAGALVHYKDKSEGSRLKYEIDGNMQLPGSHAVTYATIFGYNQGQFAGSAEFNRGSDKYRAKVDLTVGSGLNHRFNGQMALRNDIYGLEAAINQVKDKLNGNIELKMPNNHRATAKLEGRMGDSMKYATLETYWDADRDSSKRFVVNGEVRRQNDGYEGKALMQIRRRTVRASFSSNLQGRLFSSQFKTNNRIDFEWAPAEKFSALFSTNVLVDGSNQQLGSHFEIATPYQGFQNISLNVAHLYTNQQWNSELSTLLPGGNDVTLSTSGKYSFTRRYVVEASAKAITSFRGFEETSITVSHENGAREFTNSVEIKWGMDKAISYKANGALQPSNLKGSVKINTPFSQVSYITGQIDHFFSSNNYRTLGKFQWAPTKKIEFASEAKHELSGRRRICSVNFEVLSPIKGYEKTLMKVTYNNDGVTVNTNVEAKWSRQKSFVALMSASRRGQYDNRKYDGQFSLSLSPSRHFENLQLSTSLELSKNAYKFNLDSQLPYRSTVSFNSEAKIASLNDFSVNAVLTGEIPNYVESKKVSIDFVHKLDNTNLRSTLDVSCNNKQLTVLLIGLSEQQFDTRNVEFSATVNTPFRDYEELKTVFGYNQRASVYSSKLEMSKNRLNAILTHRLTIRDTLNFDTKFEMTSTSSLPTIKASIEQSSNGRQMEHTSFVQWDKNSKIHVTAQYSGKTLIKEALLKVTTPFRNYRDMELKTSMECKDYDHKGMISFEWDRRNKMTLSADIKNSRWESLDSQIAFTSPFRGYEFYAVVLKYDLTAPQKEAEVSFLWDAANKKSVSAKGQFMYSDRLTNLGLTLTTPFRDFEQTSFSAKYEHRAPSRKVTVVYNRGWRRIAFTGRSVFERDSAEIGLDFNSPYKTMEEISGSAKYSTIDDGLTGEVGLQWNKGNIYKVSGMYELRGTDGNARIDVFTPLRDYKQATLEASGSYSDSKINSEISLSFQKNQRMGVTVDITRQRGAAELYVVIQSPFENYEKMSFESKYKTRSGHYEMDAKFITSEKNTYQGSLTTKQGGAHLVDIKMTFDTPISPLKDVQLLLTLDLTPERWEFMSTLKWEEKETSAHLLLNKNWGEFYEAKVKLNTPFEDFKLFNFDSKLRNDKNHFMDGRITISTPFEILRSFDAYGEFKTDDAGYLVMMKVDTPGKTVTVSGKLSNNQFRPFLASLKVEAPFSSFKEVSSAITMDVVSWNNAKFQANLVYPRSTHNVAVSFQQDDSKLNFETKIESPTLLSRKAIASLSADYSDSNSISAESSLEILGKVHYLNGLYKSSDRNSEVQIKLESPLLPDGQSQVTGKIVKRRSTMEGEVNFEFANTNHRATAKYENRRNQMTTNMKIESDFLPSSSLESQVKYINNNERDIEAAVSISTPYSSHSVVGNLKNYDGNKSAQLKLECPLSKYLNPLTITGSLQHNDYKSVDVSLSASSMDKEVRIAGNMKNEGWKSVQAFLTLNTPFEDLSMVRVDGKYRNDRYQAIDTSFQIETSNPKLPVLGFTSKLSRSEGSEDFSLMLHLPVQNYQSVQLLGNVHYNSDYSRADSRVTFTLPRGKYVAYGQYGYTRSRISGRAEVEINNAKWSATGRLERNSEKKDISMSFSTPSALTYTVGGVYGHSGNQRSLAASYNGPSSERYMWNSSLAYDDWSNFGVDFQLNTPFRNYRSVEGSIQQQSSVHLFATNAEFSKDEQKGSLKISHRNQRDGVKGLIQFGSPLSQLKDVKMTYSRVKKHSNMEDSVELHYNRVKQFNMEIIQAGRKSSHFVLNVPVLPLTVSADSKFLDSGREMNFKSIYITRVVSFMTSYQNDARQFLHSTAFSWDERADKRVSYDFKLSSTDSGTELWSRVDVPVRSLMLKGNFTKSSRSSSAGFDFFYDATRSLEKHVAFGVVHADISTDKQTSHKVEISIEHPKLSKDIVQSNVLTYSSNEVHLRSELHYSRERHHNVLLEVKASDLSRNSRERQWKGEFMLRHPASRTDIRAAAEAVDSRVESSASFRLNSLDRHQAQNVREVRAKLMKMRQEVEMTMRSNDDQVNVAGQISGRNGEYDVLLKKKTNEQKDLITRVLFSRRNRALDISVMDTGNTGLQISASFPRESASIKVSHSKQGHQVTDALMFVGLEESKILKSKINWRPRLMTDLRIATGETLRGSLAYTKAFFSDWSSTFAEEVSMRWSLLSRSAYDLLIPFMEDIKTARLEIESDVEVAKDAFWSMYRRNEFHMQDIVKEVEHIKRVARDVANNLALGFEVLYNITVEQLENIYYTLYYACLDFCEYMRGMYTEIMWKTSRALRAVGDGIVRFAAACMERLGEAMQESYTRFQKWCDTMILRLDKWLRSYAPCIIDGYYYTKHAADKIRYSVNRVQKTVSECLFANRYYIALMDYATSVANTFKALYEYEYGETARGFLNKIYDVQIMETIMNHPTVDYMSGVANSALRKSVEVYHNLGMDAILTNAADSASNYLKTLAINSAQQYLSEFYQTKAGAKYEYEPRRGLISMEVALPAPRSSLMDVFDYKSYPEYRQLMNVNTMATEYYDDFCIWDYYYSIMKYFTPGYWLPAFRANALVSGKQHFITFDKLSYDFAGKCSYLLARDFVDGNFTAIVNYGTQDHSRRSLTLLVDDRKVDIGSDYKITLDNNKAELPIQIGHTKMIRDGANVRVENEKKGFSIVCNFVHNYCSLSLSGFYFGKTAGLLGTFNYEPSLDMMTPRRYVMEDVESFTKEWEVGQAVCTSYENFATLPTNSYKVHQKCKELFQMSTSEFRACFKQVKPETYLKMCISDLSAAHENDYNNAICESAAAYFVECKAEGVPLKMPKQCVRCEKQDGSYMTEGEAIQFPRDGTVTAADVVFLVEEKECNKDRVKYLSKLAEVIENNFRQKGYKDVRYSVVGFGGDQIHADPHIHTMDGKVSGPLRSVESALQSLEFGDGPINILEALRFAAALTYRPGTTKSFVLMKCSTCKSEEVKAEYSEMLRTLLDGDISLHLLMEQRFEMKIANKNSKARRVIGVDKKFAYTLKDVKDSRLSGDGDLLAQLRIPKDVCIPLAFEVNGSSFDSQFLLETKKNTNKKFMDVLARLVVRSSSQGTTDWGMCCECLATEDGVGKSTCQRCVSAEMASMISADILGVQTNSFNTPSSRGRKHKRSSGL